MTLDRLKYRFYRFVQVDDSGCWVWQGWRNPKGYGEFTMNGRNTNKAHRVSYELHVGPIPTGLTIDHLCRNRACVNPQHLEPVTNLENTIRGVAPAAAVLRTGYCQRGHLFEGDNVYYKSDGTRMCRPCKLAAAARWTERRRAMRGAA